MRFTAAFVALIAGTAIASPQRVTRPKPITPQPTLVAGPVPFPIPVPEPDLKQYKLLQLAGIEGISTWAPAKFTGVGRPDVCYNLPFEVTSFKTADTLKGFTCDIFLDLACRASAFTISNDIPSARLVAVPNDERPVISSWRCTYSN